VSKPVWPSLDEYRIAESGEIDWKRYNAAQAAYKKAQIDCGDICRSCGTYLLIGGNGFARSCPSCVRLATDATEVTSDKFIRCPQCRSNFDPWDGDEGGFRPDPDETEVTCPRCQHDFQVKVVTTFTYYSPPLLPLVGESDGECDEGLDEEGGDA
jgi:rubrerythrin